jgi:hypothetical protein
VADVREARSRIILCAGALRCEEGKSNKAGRVVEKDLLPRVLVIIMSRLEGRRRRSWKCPEAEEDAYEEAEEVDAAVAAAESINVVIRR